MQYPARIGMAISPHSKASSQSTSTKGASELLGANTSSGSSCIVGLVSERRKGTEEQKKKKRARKEDLPIA
jgi:hypothetical protein